MSKIRLECLTSPNLKATTIGDTTTVSYDLNSHCPCGKKYIEHEYWQEWASKQNQKTEPTIFTTPEWLQQYREDYEKRFCKL